MKYHKKILLTGSSGFIGTPLLKEMTDRKFHVMALSKSPKKNTEIAGDITKRDSLENVAENNSFDTLIHLAAFFPKSPEETNHLANIEVNLNGTINLFQTFESNLKSFIFISSIDVYGKTRAIPVKENHKRSPQNLYALSKTLAEDYLKYACKKKDISLNILRISHVYGPGEKSKKVIPCFIERVINNEEPIIYGDGSDVRDYVYIDDVVEAIILAINKNSGGVYNISSGKGTSIKELAEKIIKLSGSRLKPRFVPSKVNERKIFLNIEKAYNELSYSPKINLDYGLKREINYFKGLK